MIRVMRALTSFSFVLLVPNLALSAESSSSTEEAVRANIHAGNWNVGGNVDFSKYSGRRNDASTSSASLVGKYFLIDHLALGVGAGVTSASDQSTVATVGPTASYFFWNDGHRLATHAEIGIRFGLTSATVLSFDQVAVGADYFLVPTVALGPLLYFDYYNSKVSDYQRSGLAFNLAIYL